MKNPGHFWVEINSLRLARERGNVTFGVGKSGGHIFRALSVGLRIAGAGVLSFVCASFMDLALYDRDIQSSIGTQTATTTRRPGRSTARSKPRSSIVAAHGAASKPSNTQHSNGSTGSTTAACSSPPGTSRPQKPKQTTTQLWKMKPWPRN